MEKSNAMRSGGLMEYERNLRIKKFCINYALYALVIVLLIVYAVLAPDTFLTAANMKGLLVNASPLLIVSIGMTFVLLTGEIDLSVGSIASVCAMVWMVSITKLGMPIFAATVLSILLGALLGAVNAVLITKLKINSFLVTLGMQTLLRGATYLIDESRILTTEPIKKFVGSSILGIPSLIFISVALIVVMALIYKFTPFGRRVQAVGCNRKAAAKVGIHVPKTVALSFVLCGLFAGIAGLVQVANVGQAIPADIGDGMEFLSITAVVLGGTSLFGGVGTLIPGTLVGVYFYQAIENGLGVLGVTPYLYPVVKGIVIYLAMVTDSLKRSMRNAS